LQPSARSNRQGNGSAIVKTWQEHIQELAQAICNCRELCGNESAVIREYLSENGFAKGSVNAIMIADKARIEASRNWDLYRRDAGVTTPIDDNERAAITRMMDKS
jgi:hypothetical protein